MAMSDYFLRTLFVHTPGTRLVLESDALKALHDEAPPRRLPLRAIDTVVVSGGVDVSTPLLVRCAEDGRLVAFVSRFGKPRAIVSGEAPGRGHLRLRQFEAHFDAERRLQLAKSIVAGKLDQMSWGLRQWARDLDDELATQLRDLAGSVEADREGAVVAASRDAALGIEGIATRRYFGGLGIALRSGAWKGRNRRPARDPVNATLSFLYGMARLAVQGAVHVSGLDPCCGFLHGDTDGQPALVLDLLEEFRPSVDRVVVTLFNRHQLRAEHFELDALGSCSLTADGREVVMNAWHTHRMSKVKVAKAVAPIPRAAMPLVQANAMANALRRGAPYVSHRMAVA
ncbi:MAG: CRISPR-associated endonuclease Cas1 [Nocardioides sp.]|uniref:CRISPR-associated endonuclease Cas1 n=1 Tax=Nocardioides sp. TaxID=35761 RepID=UPI0039E2A189